MGRAREHWGSGGASCGLGRGGGIEGGIPEVFVVALLGFVGSSGGHLLGGFERGVVSLVAILCMMIRQGRHNLLHLDSLGRLGDG